MIYGNAIQPERKLTIRLLASGKKTSIREGDAWALINSGMAMRAFDIPPRDKMVRRKKCKAIG